MKSSATISIYCLFNCINERAEQPPTGRHPLFPSFVRSVRSFSITATRKLIVARTGEGLLEDNHFTRIDGAFR